MWLFKYLFTNLYRALQTANGRRLLWLFLRYANRPRHQSGVIPFLRYRFDVPDALSFVWQFKEIFADESYQFNTTTPQPLIIDCGANIGTSLAYFRQTYPQARIVAFEADPAIGAVLTRNLQANGITGVEVINKAVWINDDGLDFGTGEADAASMFSEAGRRRVPSVRLRDVLLRETRVDMLKIDIEGAETDVLLDCHDALTNVQNLFIEYHAYIGHPQTLGGIVNLLEQNGFRYYIDSNQARTRPLVNHRYRSNDLMDLQLNIYAHRP
ncbi:FkbM family methyltransferase [Spirosoma montaniterrae]|uniref:FkbM family methyltransferase n=1 Tax=Spirosoma montaniterrae TaxID=1178516 RepID=A0A1P9WZE3_9BACT|nr:FkbM family methyltransferase [Spirosoma montaniterrae]AQG80757.1 FkbM family methyltransferase [Spirosoma montaniterrae]